jgi:hypothetical protein
MRYWFYSDGNILGPYGTDELMGLPAFGNGSLVCPEDSTGDNPDDWKAADSVPEIANVLSVGAGQVVSSENAYISNAYGLETGFSTRSAKEYFEAKSDDLSPGDNLLDTIDTILGAYDKGQIKENEVSNIDYNLSDKFDIKLSQLQEQLEASKWEKNLLLEKMKVKDVEELRNKEKISELEKKLDDAIARMEKGASIAPAVSNKLTDQEKDKISKVVISQEESDERLRKEQAAFENELAAELKEMAKSRNISESAIDHVLELKKFSNEDKDTSATDHILSNKLKSLGYAKSKRIFEDDYRKEAEEIEQEKEEEVFVAPKEKEANDEAKDIKKNNFPAPQKIEEKKAPKRELENSLNIDSSAMVYDFTAVTPAQHSSRHEEQVITIEENKPLIKENVKSASVIVNKSEPEIKKEPSPKPSFGGTPFMHPETGASKKIEPEVKPAPEPFVAQAPVTNKPVATNLKPGVKTEVAKEAPLEDKTERILLKPKGNDKPVKTEAPKKKKFKKSSMMFITVVIVFGAIIAGGLGFFFMGEGSLSNFSLMSFSSKKDGAKKIVAKKAPEKQPVAQAKPVVSANENVRIAINIVKNHKLVGGRGSVAIWLSNSFLSGSSSGLNEEWSATILHKDVFVTQYRLLRQRKEPVIYQFEVDVKKGAIVRGINNNAIELLDFPVKKKVIKKPVSKKKPARKVKPRKKKLRTLPQLPLPAPPRKNFKQEEPSGFENITLSANDKVKYIRAQESDEELF